MYSLRIRDQALIGLSNDNVGYQGFKTAAWLNDLCLVGVGKGPCLTSEVVFNIRSTLVECFPTRETDSSHG